MMTTLPQRRAVIDCGTNSFSLLIADCLPDQTFSVVARHSDYVYLASGGISHIDAAAFERGLAVMGTFRHLCDEHQVSHISAIGTAALRTAANGTDFAAEVKHRFGIALNIISGAEEARLIYHGVRQAYPLEPTSVIMDIGGGSVEFIICDAERVFWEQSFPVGISVLHSRFHKHEPISPDDIQAINDFLTDQLQPFAEAVRNYRPLVLVGASGAFDVLDRAMVQRPPQSTFSNIALDTNLEAIFDETLNLDLESRKALSYMLPSRALYFPVSVLLIRYALSLITPHRLGYSAYALKQGVLALHT